MKLKLYLPVIAGILLSACSNMDDMPLPENNDSGQKCLTQIISKADALEIANKVLGRSSTRNGNASMPEFDYVFNEHGTRNNSSLPDTLAYVINYPDNRGFVIVSSDRRVYPVLAFSNEGCFSFDNEIAKDNFIAKIGAHLESADENASYDVTDSDFDGCHITYPTTQVSLSQRSPWNKYVIKEHPGCPAGCVAVATAIAISHSSVILNYHGALYHLKSMLKAIKKGPDTTGQSQSSRNRFKAFSLTDIYEPTYTYEQAVDSMAKLIYWIGKDVKMNYSVDGSGADSKNAFMLCSSLGVMSDDAEYNSYNISDIAYAIKDGNMVYLRGRDTGGAGGHAWIVDGCEYCIDPTDQTKITNVYLHCDWGWGGTSNGYYSGNVFETTIGYNFAPLNYFVVYNIWNDTSELVFPTNPKLDLP